MDIILASPHYVTGAIHKFQPIAGPGHNVQRLCIPFSSERLPHTTTRIDFLKLIASLSLINWNTAFARLSDVDHYAMCFYNIKQDSLNQAKYTSTFEVVPIYLKLIHAKRHLRGYRHNSGQDGALRAARNRVRASIRKCLVYWESALFKSKNHRNLFAVLNGRLGRNQGRSARIALQDGSLSEADTAAMFSK